MTAPRRSLLLFVAAAAFLCPACISISTKTAPPTPPEVAAQIVAEAAAKANEAARKSDFAVYARPGDTIATKPAPKDTTTAQKPNPNNAAIAPPLAPVVPGGGVPIASDPNTLLVQARATVLPEPPLLTAVKAYIEGRPERAIEAIAALDRPNQDFVLAILPILARGASADLIGDPTCIAMLADQLHSAARHLESRAALRVDAMLFCRAVYAFGRYDPWPANQPYHPNDPAQLYLEVRNIVSQPAVGPRGETYLTHARAQVEVRDAHNNLMPLPDPSNWRQRVPVARFEEKRYTRAPIQDFHMLYVFPVPATPGVYTVTVELRDAAGRRVVKTAPAEFQVAGP